MMTAARLTSTDDERLWRCVPGREVDSVFEDKAQWQDRLLPRLRRLTTPW